MEALALVARRLAHSEIVNLPRLHAKVYIADGAEALVTSANLTPSGLDLNLEYGVSLTLQADVRAVQADLSRYAGIGTPLTLDLLNELTPLAEELRREFAAIEKESTKQLKKRFSAKLKQANAQFLRAQVGARTAHAIFADAIVYLLSKRPLPTSRLHLLIQQLLPDLCDDSVELVINGERFGKRWKHNVRNAQQSLKRTGRIHFDGKMWSIV